LQLSLDFYLEGLSLSVPICDKNKSNSSANIPERRPRLNFKLDYDSDRAIERVFNTIGTQDGLDAQIKPKARPGHSIIAFIEDNDQKPFQDAIDKIRKAGHRFRWSSHMHCTLLSLDRKTKENFNRYDLELIYHDVKDFIEKKKLSKLRISFDIIHPGKDDQDFGSSDGTVIALARMGNAYNDRFLEIIHELKDYLNTRSYLKAEAQHKVADTIWCTLGFFDEPPFEVDKAIYEIFNMTEFRNFSAIATFNEITIAEYRMKSLDDVLIRYKINCK
jgi:hypothetical protein